MRACLFLLVIFLFCSCGKKENYFNWLEGTWRVKTTSDTVYVFHEKWWYDEEQDCMRGIGFEALKSDTSWFESLSIEKIKNQWYYRAHVPSEHGDDTINFILMTEPGSDSLAFQNEENNFPGAIRYMKRSADLLTIMLETAPGVVPEAEYTLEVEKVK